MPYLLCLNSEQMLGQQFTALLKMLVSYFSLSNVSRMHAFYVCMNGRTPLNSRFSLQSYTTRICVINLDVKDCNCRKCSEDVRMF